MGIQQAIAMAAVLRTRQEIRVWKARYGDALEGTINLANFPRLTGSDRLFEEGDLEWMRQSDLNIFWNTQRDTGL